MTATADPSAETRAGERTTGASVARHVPGEVGLWVFLIGDMVVFGLFFGMIVVLRGEQTDTFTAAQSELHLGLGVLNTIVLLTSSLFVVAGVALARARDARAPKAFLLAVACGLAFAAIKAVEYTSLVSDGHTPPTDDFYLYYFMFTGIHLGHVTIGTGGLLAAARMARPEHTGRHRDTGLEGIACFWHLVDLLWIMLFALLYLVA